MATFPLETPRLLLRPFVPADRGALLDLFSRPEVCRYLYTKGYTEATIGELLDRRLARTAIERPGDGLALAVLLRDGGRVVGDVMLTWADDVHRHAEIGYVFHPDVAGHGYATEAGRALLLLAFEQLGLHRVSATLDARNAASAGVLERLGLRREGLMLENEWIKGEWTDELHYAVLEQEWREGLDRQEGLGRGEGLGWREGLR